MKGNKNIGTPILSGVAKGKYVVIPGIITTAVINDISIAAMCLEVNFVKVCFLLALVMRSHSEIQ